MPKSNTTKIKQFSNISGLYFKYRHGHLYDYKTLGQTTFCLLSSDFSTNWL